MAENTSRGLFKLNGITGMLIATVLLLSILVFLITNAIIIENKAIKKPYDDTIIRGNLDTIKEKSVDNLTVMQKVWGKE